MPRFRSSVPLKREGSGGGRSFPRGVSDRRQLGELNLLLPLPSWWQMKRYFTRLGNRRSVHYKPYPDIVIVPPEPRFTTAMTAEQWREACILALVSFCNHGPCCAETTFVSLKSLQALPPDALEALMHDFASLGPQEVSPRRSSSEALRRAKAQPSAGDSLSSEGQVCVCY